MTDLAILSESSLNINKKEEIEEEIGEIKMMTIRIEIIDKKCVEITTLHETNGSSIKIYKLPYISSDEYCKLLDENLTNKEIPITTYGDVPENSVCAQDRYFLIIKYADKHDNENIIVLNHGDLYIMQDGKTIEKTRVPSAQIIIGGKSRK
jgi:hypothetical protein